MDELIGKPKVQQWEYHREFTKMETVGVDEFLNVLGGDGWELMQVLERNTHGWYYIFKRPLP